MKYCCDYFPGLLACFHWFYYTDDNEVNYYLMPNLRNDKGEKIRVNHCPVCGTEIRDIMISEEEFNNIRNED